MEWSIPCDGLDGLAGNFHTDMDFMVLQPISREAVLVITPLPGCRARPRRRPLLHHPP
jgi:hypothetical protein